MRWSLWLSDLHQAFEQYQEYIGQQNIFHLLVTFGKVLYVFLSYYTDVSIIISVALFFILQAMH